jgi:hypothetical protein
MKYKLLDGRWPDNHVVEKGDYEGQQLQLPTHGQLHLEIDGVWYEFSTSEWGFFGPYEEDEDDEENIIDRRP